jgi:hypothetical protein
VFSHREQWGQLQRHIAVAIKVFGFCFLLKPITIKFASLSH